MRGHDVLCLAAEEDGAFARLCALGAEPVALSGWRRSREKHAVRELALALGGLAPDVCMAVSWPSARLGIAGAARAGVPWIVAAFPELAAALAPDEPGGNARLTRECAALLSRCHAAIVPGLSRDPVVRGRSILPGRIETAFVAGPGADLAGIAHAPLAPLSKGMVYLAVAHPHSEAGMVAYCESARRLAHKGVGATYLAVSPAGVTPSVELLALLKAHRGIVRYLGPRADIERLLARAHAVVLPSDAPCLPAEIVQALAVGRPVIAADVAARRRAIQNGVNGRRVPVGDAEALTEAMSDLLRRPDRIPSFAKASRAIARAEFDMDATLGQTLRTLRL